MDIGRETGEQDPALMGRSAETQKATHDEVDGVLEGAISAYSFSEDVPRISLDQGNIMGISTPAKDVTVWKFVLDPGLNARLVVIAKQRGKLSGLVHKAAKYQGHANSSFQHRTRYDDGHSMSSDEAREILEALHPIAKRRNTERVKRITTFRPNYRPGRFAGWFMSSLQDL